MATPMDPQSLTTNLLAEFDEVIPPALIAKVTADFLDEADWSLEIEGSLLEVPKIPQPMLISRAFVAAHSPDVFLGDHYEAVVALDPRIVGESIVAQAGYLKFYFDSHGRFIAEDRFLTRLDS